MPTSDSNPPSAAENMYYVRKKIDEMALCITDLKNDVTFLKVEMGKQVIKSGIVGAIGGALPVVALLGIAILAYFLKG